MRMASGENARGKHVASAGPYPYSSAKTDTSSTLALNFSAHIEQWP
jgi:hypothetical protein